MSEIEQAMGKVRRLGPMESLRHAIDATDQGIARLSTRRDEIDAALAALKAERDQVEATIADAKKKCVAYHKAYQTVESAADLAPNLLAELEPSVGEEEAPPTLASPAPSTPPPPISSSNGKPKGNTLERVKDCLRGEWRSREGVELVVGAPKSTVVTYLSRLVNDGHLETRGNLRNREYRLKETRAATTPAAERKARPSSEDKPKGAVGKRQEPIDEGKVLSVLQGGRTDIATLSIKVGVTIPKLRDLLGKLMREGDVRVQKGNPPEYYAVL